MNIDRFSEIIDKLRIAPRVIVVMYGILFYQASSWFMGLADPTGTQATFVSVLVGAAGAIFGFYVNTGGKKDDK